MLKSAVFFRPKIKIKAYYLFAIIFVFIYNIHVMNIEEFKLLEEKTLDDIKNSSYFKNAKRLSDEISSSPLLQEFAKKRDDAYLIAATTDDLELRRKKEIEAKKYNDLLLNSDIVKEYLENYKIVKEFLNKINEKILMEFRYD